MSAELIHDAFIAYARDIRSAHAANPDVSEPALAPRFQTLIETLLPLLPTAPELTIGPEFNNPGVGRPDIALIRPGPPPRAFIELKALSKHADPERWTTAHDKKQYARFQELAHWGTSNFVDFCLFERDEQIGQASVVPEQTLRATTSDNRAAELIEEHDSTQFLRLLQHLANAEPPTARNAQNLAHLMAHSARLVRSIVADRLAELADEGIEDGPLLQVRQTFRDALYARPEAGGYASRDFDQLFSAAFAQTLAFGLLLVREDSDGPVDRNAWEDMPEEHPLMRTTLRVLSQPEVRDDIGVGFTVMLDTVNSFAPDVLALREDGSDPILYFYEDFLEIFDPAAREKYGVYYTPIEVVRYMVGALDRALRENLGTNGLADQNVTILDPATGTGTFLLGIAERVREQVEASGGAGLASLALHDLARRMFGFELLVGPYAVAHFRLHRALSHRQDEAENPPPELPRLGIYLADTLARPNAEGDLGSIGWMADGLRDERRQANRIKNEQPILAIIGNPPYRRLEAGENETLVGRWVDEMWDDLKSPVREAGQGGQLNTFPELSIAFWRWSIWKIFEADNAPERGVVAFISNRKFLTGWPYAGLRKMLRERFDRIEIIDLRGDVRAGARAGAERDQGVFNIKVGTCITIAIADGSKAEGELGDIFYRDSWTDMLLSRRSKLDWLQEESEEGRIPQPVQVNRGILDDMRPEPFQNGELASLSDCFSFRSSGVQTKRDNFVYAISREQLSERLTIFQNATDEAALELFHPTGAKPWNAAQAQEINDEQLIQTAYRPLDNRTLCKHPAFIDRRRPSLQEAWGPENICFYAMPSGTRAGPALWCHGLLPDYHAFRGSYGGYAFPLYDRRPEENDINLSPHLLEGLNAAYGGDVPAEDIFDAILALLSANSYTIRFAEDLEDVFPHVPFPAHREVFNQAVAIGSAIRAVETFARAPDRDHVATRLETAPTGVLGDTNLRDGEIILCADGSGRLTGVTEAVWSFAVSGYRILPRWLDAREGQPVDLELVEQIRDIVARIAELIDLFGQADNVLEATLADCLTREALGFGDEETEDDGQD